MTTSSPRHIPANQGQSISILGMPTTIKISAADSGGACFLAEQTVPPGHGVPPHIHSQEDEIFFVLEGEVEYRAGDKTVTARAGDIVHAPRDAPHGYQVTGDTPAVIRFLVTPGHLEAMFLEMAEWPRDAPPDPEKLTALCARYDIRFLPQDERT